MVVDRFIFKNNYKLRCPPSAKTDVELPKTGASFYFTTAPEIFIKKSKLNRYNALIFTAASSSYFI